MKRLQISIEPELDTALGAEARKQGVSKAALVRRWVAAELTVLPPLEEDPLWKWVGGSDIEPVEDIDTYLYGPIEHGK